jgi:hypothetical protein
VVATSRQIPAPSQVRGGVSTAPEQVWAAQGVPAASVVQFAIPFTAVQLRHLPVQAAPQHAPSTQ